MDNNFIKDNLVIATIENGQARIISATTTELVNEGIKIHNCTATSSAAFGRMLTAGILMGAMLKNTEDIITLKIDGKGPINGILVTCKEDCSIKGYMGNPFVEIPANGNGKLDVGGAIGKDGNISVTKDIGLKNPYSGQVPIVSGEIGEDLAYYFTVSEQTPSAVALGVLVSRDIKIKASGGFIVQVMPDGDELFADLLTYRLQEAKSVSQMITEGKDAKGMIEEVFSGMDINYLEEKKPSYRCDCSLDKVEKALISIGEEELSKIYEEGKNESVHCNFCNKTYNFNREDIKNLLEISKNR